jgi:predicted RNA polymerase sigma factor
MLEHFAESCVPDWQQIVEWYDELVRLTGKPGGRLNRAVSVGEVDAFTEA